MFYLFLLAHLIADFALQPYWLVARKRHWDGLMIHGGIVLACMLVLGAADRAALALWPCMLAITAVHVFADWWKVHRADRILRPAIVPFMLDQLIHVVTLAVVLGFAVPAERLWSFGITLSQAALYGAAYTVAVLAAPIAVMIWLDPTFRHAALAPAARLRSGTLGMIGVSLALFGGAMAMPVALLGVVIVLRRPTSRHPLDTPIGMIAVLVLASFVGASLRMLLS